MHPVRPHLTFQQNLLLTAMIFSTTGNKATIDRKLEERSKKLASVDVNLSPDQEAYLKATGTRPFVCLLRVALKPRRIASEIVSFIADGKWTASAVLEAYIQRSVQAQEATNCVTESESRLVQLG